MAATAGAVVERLLRRLAADARRLELPSNIEEDVVHVGRTLARLQDLLASMERRYFRICADAQEWMGRIKQIVCDMEDLLDEFEDLRGIRSQKIGSWIAKISRSQRMKLIRRKLEISTEDSLIYSLMQHSSYDLEPSNKHQVFDGTAVIGRDDDKNNIKRLLMQDHADKLAIVPIVGPAGSGKTTLARLVFHDKAGVESHSELRIWVYLNKKLELKKIAQDIISQANEMENIIMVPEVPADDQIQNNLQIIKNRLREVLHCRSSLIVLDDLYSTDKIQLAELTDMLRGQKKCTKIIVTTSSETTAELVHSVPPYQLGPMSEGDCWEIFSQKAFNNQDANTNLTEIGKKIVKNCEGMPGIAYSLGSVMRNQDEGSWLWARDKEIWELEKRFSMGVKILAPFSELYNNMPSALKLCFGYLSIFPKGSIIDKDKLVQQWMSLDMVGSTHGTLPDHVRGEMYINDLLSTFFLRIEEMSLTTGISRSNGPMVVQMHNLVHAFAKYVASNDLIILDCGDMSNSPSGEKISYNYVVVKNDAGQSTPKKELLTKARALSFKNCSTLKLLADAFSKLKHLRVLDLTRCHFVELPASIGCLKHLRYLDCSGLKIRTLPNQMSSLQNLEALDLSESYIEECPTFVGSYPHLAYLNLRGCGKLHNLPSSLGDLKRLQYLNLSYCSGVSKVLESLCGLHLLRFLDLSNCTELQEFPHLFGNLTNLEYLNLSACSRLENLPESFGNLVFLRFLSLSGCSELKQLPESIIGLVNLQYLNLAQVLLQLPKSLSKLERLHTLDITGYRLSVSSEAAPTFSSIIQNIPNLKLLLTDDSDIENYASQHIQCSPDVGAKSFQIRNLVKEGKSCAEGANLVQMQSSPYASNLQDVNLHEEIKEVKEDEHTNDSIDVRKEIIEDEVSCASTGGYVSMCPESSAGASSKLASWNEVALRNSSTHGSAAIACTLLYPRRDEILESVSVKAFTFNELKMATQNFRSYTLLSEGRLWSTFKGWVDKNTLAPTKLGIGIPVAVKELNQEDYMDHREWLDKVNYIGQLSHPHLVKLIGYCLEDEHRLLVYEFMAHGSLNDHLSWKGSLFNPISWNIRMKIALEVAEAMRFLHSQDAQIIVHAFTSSNVLLDSNYTAKISSFGLVKHGQIDYESHVSTRVMGTWVYAAPEYITTGRFTTKSDVYRFGVVLLELLSGLRAYDATRPSHQMDLVSWCRPYLEKKKHRVRSVMDSRLKGQYSLSRAQKAAKLASQCLSVDPVQRPSMEQVVKVLAQLQDDKKIDKKKLSLSHGSKELTKWVDKLSLSHGSKVLTNASATSSFKNKRISWWFKSSLPKREGVDTNTAALPDFSLE